MNFNAHGYLEPGIHNADLSAIEEHFVRGFPTSNTRPKIIEGCKRHRSEIEAFNPVSLLPVGALTPKATLKDIALVKTVIERGECEKVREEEANICSRLLTQRLLLQQSRFCRTPHRKRFYMMSKFP